MKTPEEKRAANRIYRARYRATANGRACDQRYRNSGKGRATRKRNDAERAKTPKHRAWAKEYYKRKRAERGNKWQAENRRQWRDRNKDRIRAYDRLYRRQNKHRINAKRRALISPETHRLNNIRFREDIRASQRRSAATLSDSYVKAALLKTTFLSANDVPVALLEAYRALLMAKRAVWGRALPVPERKRRISELSTTWEAVLRLKHAVISKK